MSNICENLKDKNIKCNVDGCELELISYGLDSINMMFEFNLKLSNKYKKIKSPEIFIETFILQDDQNKKYGTEHQTIQSSYCSKINENEFKIFKVISFIDKEFISKEFMDDIFKNSKKLSCEMVIGTIEDAESYEVLNISEDFKFNVSKSIIKKNLKAINILYNEQNYKDICIEVESIKPSTYGNIILLNAKKEFANINIIEDINKLDFTIKDCKGNKIDIIKRFDQVFVYNYEHGKMHGKELKILLLVDYNEDLNYTIEAFENENIIVNNRRFKNENKRVMEKLRFGDYVLTADDQLYLTDDEVDIAGYNIDEYGVYFCNKTYRELEQIAKML